MIIYHAWEPYQFPGGKSYDIAIPGLIKWLHLAGGYGHLQLLPLELGAAAGRPRCPVEVEKVA